MWHWKLNDDHEKEWACPPCPSKRCASFLSSVFGFELGLSRIVEIGAKSVISFARVSFELDKWHWRTIKYLLYTTRSFAHHFIATCEYWNWSYPLETLKPTKWVIFGQCDIEIVRVTLKDTIRHRLYTRQSFVHHLFAICKLKLGLSCRNTDTKVKLPIFWAVSPSNWTDDLEKQ